ncbi:hypothetical protein ABW20_dc0102341 [Dactylellina cionopaga]|nr:hypothetical protein ABW20_dc0102341 [Dactylellina cionopaga]
MTVSPRAYMEKPIAPPASHFGGIQDEVPIGAGMLDPSQHQQLQYQPPSASPPAATPKTTFTFSRKTIIILVVVVVIIIGALVGGLVGGLKSKSSGSSSSSPGDQTSSLDSTSAQTSGPSRSSGGTSSRDSATSSTSSLGRSDTSSTRATTTSSGSPTDTTGSSNADDPYPTTATFTLADGNGVSGISPTPFPGFDEPVSSSSLLTNGDFKTGNLDGWTNDDSCWSVLIDPSSSSPLQKSTTNNDFIARNNANDLSGGKSCNLSQVVKGLPPGSFELTFLWGNYDWNEGTWFYASAGGANKPILLLAMQEVPGFLRYQEWTKAAYSIDFEGGDFVVTFSAHSNVTTTDVAQVQLIRK